MIVEIVNPQGKVSYTRPHDHPDVLEALKTPGYSVRGSEAAVADSLQRVVGHGERDYVWAERQLMKMQDEETNPALRALWSTAARIARERMPDGKGKVSNEEVQRPRQ